MILIYEKLSGQIVAESEDRMKDKLKEAIEELFENVPESEEIKELKEEMISNAEEKYEDLIQRGFTEEQSYTMVMGSIGDIQELLSEMGQQEDEAEDAKKDYWEKQKEYWDRQCEYWEWQGEMLGKQAENLEKHARNLGKQAKEAWDGVLESGVFEEITKGVKSIFDEIAGTFQFDGEKSENLQPGVERSFSTDGIQKIVLDVQNCSVDVDVQLTMDDEIMIQESLLNAESEKGPALEFTVSGNQLRACYPTNVFGSPRRGIVRVFLPEGFAGTLEELKITTSSGDVTLEDLGASKQSIKTVSGNVKGACSIGDVFVGTVSGDVSFDDIEGAAEIRTVSGDVKIGKAVGKVNACSTSGDVEIGKLEGDGIFRSTSGDVEIDLVKAGEKLEVSTMSGDAIVKLPEEASVEMTLNSTSGDIHTFCDNLQTDEKVNYVRNGKRAVGTVGEEPFLKLKISTVSGDVSVTR